MIRDTLQYNSQFAVRVTDLWCVVSFSLISNASRGS